MDVVVEVAVQAPPSVVWAVLADPERWPDWTDSVAAVELPDDALRLGARVRVAQPGLRTMVWTVTAFAAGSGFTWAANAAGVRTEGSHEIHPLDSGRSRLVLGIHQRGLLAPAVGLLLGRRTGDYVRAEAAGLKAAAEHAHADGR